jgi:integrase
MARKLNLLTDLFVQSVTPEKGSKLYLDGGNLLLQVTPTNSKSWIFRYALEGKARSIGLGPVHTISLSEARAEALRLRKLLLSGKDPKIERDRELQAEKLTLNQTFRAFAKEFIAGLESSHRSKKAHAQWTSSLECYAYPVIGDVPLADIDVHLVLKVLTRRNAWQSKPETMRRVRGRIERILGAAAVLGLRSPDNPARFANYLSEVLPKQLALAVPRHHPSMPYQQIPQFMALIRLEPAVSYRALEFLTLTAARTTEVLGAKWSEVDFPSQRWSIPGSRMKSGRPHRIPLSTPALNILERQRDNNRSEYVFPGAKAGRPLSQMAMLQAMRGLRERGLLEVEAVPHGQRAVFRTWAASATEFPRELAEAALAHSLSALEQAYQRGDQLERRRDLMDAWASYCYGIDPTT